MQPTLGARATTRLGIGRLAVHGHSHLPNIDLCGAGGAPLPGLVTLELRAPGAGRRLFDVIYRVFTVLQKPTSSFPPELGSGATTLRVDIALTLPGSVRREARFVQGDDAFLREHGGRDGFGFRRHAGRFHPFYEGDATLMQRTLSGWIPGPLPALLYFPSVARDQDDASSRRNRTSFAHRWCPPNAWREPVHELEAQLRGSSARLGSPAHAALEAYQQELEAFTGGQRCLRWRDQELVIDACGFELPLSSLSDAERRAMVLAAELRKRWHPGSLVLLEEPDLHLRAAWQHLLLDRIQALIRERGGQVWIATTSGHLLSRVADVTRHRLPARPLQVTQVRPTASSLGPQGVSALAWRGGQPDEQERPPGR